MSTMTTEQRGDLAQEMLPEAANLAMLVHGDGGPEDIAEVLARLDDTQKNALIVVLAGMVDPEQPVGKGLSWTAVTKNAALPMPAWLEQKPLREHVVETVEEVGEDFVDWAAVTKFVQGFRVEMTDADFLAAVQQCVAMEMTLADIDRMRGWRSKTSENWVNRLRKRYQRSGRDFPSLAQPAARVFTEQEVIAIRERSVSGASDVELGMSYSVSRETIRAIVRGQRYPEYGGPLRTGRSAQSLEASREHMCGHAAISLAAHPKDRFGPGVLKPTDRDAIRRRVNDGEDIQQLAREYQVSARTIRHYSTPSTKKVAA